MRKVEADTGISPRTGWILLAASVAAPLAMDLALWLWRSL